MQWRRKFEEVSEELTSLGEVRKTVKGLQKEVESLISQNKVRRWRVYVCVCVCVCMCVCVCACLCVGECYCVHRTGCKTRCGGVQSTETGGSGSQE